MKGGGGVRRFDVAVVGAGVLGVTIAYWISRLYDSSVVLIDGADGVAMHTSSRNTGVMHRPFYLDPSAKKVFAAAAERSFPLWEAVARAHGLPWRRVGTLEVAQTDSDLATLEKYKGWGARNGIREGELELLDRRSVGALEPEVRGTGAIHSKGDVSVDFGLLTRAMGRLAASGGVTILKGSVVASVADLRGELLIRFNPGGALGEVRCGFMVNAAGGGSVDIAHMLGVGLGYTDLHFRGDYWLVDPSFASRVSRNIYSVARHRQFPFLDPHFVIRADGVRQIGPNAALVAGPFTYRGVGVGILAKIVEPPVRPKARLLSNGEFVSMVWDEWRSSMSKSAMCARVRRFIPNLDPSLLVGRGLSGVRSSLVDNSGFVPEALLLSGCRSLHVLNYNSPGATGAPVFSALVVERLRREGAFDGARPRPGDRDGLWSYAEVAGYLGDRGLL